MTSKNFPDNRDLAILRHLSCDAWMTLAELGRAVSLSPSAVQRRLVFLRKAGLLAGARAVVAGSALGKPLRLFVVVELNDERPATLRAAERAVSLWPDITGACFVTGAYDLILSIETSSMGAYSEFIERVLTANVHVKRVRTLTVLRDVVSGTSRSPLAHERLAKR